MLQSDLTSQPGALGSVAFVGFQPYRIQQNAEKDVK